MLLVYTPRHMKSCARRPFCVISCVILVYLLQALAEKNAAIAESERCQRKLGLANRLIAALASEGDRWALTVQQLRKDYLVSLHDLKCFIVSITAAFTYFALS